MYLGFDCGCWQQKVLLCSCIVDQSLYCLHLIGDPSAQLAEPEQALQCKQPKVEQRHLMAYVQEQQKGGFPFEPVFLSIRVRPVLYSRSCNAIGIVECKSMRWFSFVP